AAFCSVPPPPLTPPSSPTRRSSDLIQPFGEFLDRGAPGGLFVQQRPHRIRDLTATAVPDGDIHPQSGHVCRVVLGGLQHLLGGLDRKSTRLNSSHVSISYAVFCLKK